MCVYTAIDTHMYVHRYNNNSRNMTILSGANINYEIWPVTMSSSWISTICTIIYLHTDI